MSLLDMEANTSFILLTSLYIAKKTVLMNWKPKTAYVSIYIEIYCMIKLIRRKLLLLQKTNDFVSLWSPLISYIT